MERSVKFFATTFAVAALSLAGCSPNSSTSAPAAAALPSGIDIAGMDKSVRPGDDFFAFANGGWIKATTIPADKSEFGVATILVDQTRKQTVEIIQDPVNAGPNATPDARKLADFYASYVDEAGIEAKGLAPLKPRLDAIAAIADKRALARAIGETLRADVDPLNATNFETENLLGVFVAQGLNDPDHNVPYLLQGGLGMPDRDYYVSSHPKMAALRAEYKRHVGAILTLAGFSGAAARAARIVDLDLPIVGWSMLIAGLMLTPFYAGRGTTFVIDGSLLLAFDMMVAYLTADPEALHFVFSDPGKFYNADPYTFLFASLLILIFGPGRFALDWLLRRRLKDLEPASTAA